MFTPEAPAFVAPPVNIVSLEHGTSLIWHEFLSGWFNGAGHILSDGQGATTFPVASDFAFGASSLKQPVDGLSFVMVTVQRPDTRHPHIESAAGRLQNMRWHWRLYVRAKLAKANLSEQLCLQASDLTYAVLSSEHVHLAPLAGQGLFNIRTEPAQVIAAADAPTRVLNLKAEIQPAKLK